MLDLAIIGAGPAGIAAARAALARGLSVQLLEARSRIGGRVVTDHFAGHPVDLGAHWLHAGPINPVVAFARAEGWRLKRAPQAMQLFHNGRREPRGAMRAYQQAFARADAALSLSGPCGDDRAAARLPFLGPWRKPVAAITGLVCGRPLDEVSAQDFASSEYADNLFAPDGFGSLIAKAARGLPVSLATVVSAVDWSGPTIAITASGGQIAARKLIVTVPPVVLQRGAIRFTPALPDATASAIHGFRAAIYEHVVLRWPSAPFRAADEIATLTGLKLDGVGLLTRLDGSPLHFLELDEPMSAGLGHPRHLRAAHHVRALLARQFGHRALADLAVLQVSDWQGDPMSASSWSSVPPGLAHIRDDLAQPVAARIAFAGEMTDHDQWGTVGGAWNAGERAVAALFPS